MNDIFNQILHHAKEKKFSSQEDLFSEIENIYKNIILNYLKPSPLKKSYWLSDILKGNVYLKLESLNPNGSFKVRGGLNAVKKLMEMHPGKHLKICAASAGNHAQGVAFAAKELGCEAHIFLPTFAPLVKRDATEKLGAKIYLIGNNIEEAAEAALEFAQKEKAHFIHPFNNSDIILGQATCAYEAYEQWENIFFKENKKTDLDYYVCSVGGGGFIAGAGLFFHSHPQQLKTKIIGVEQEYYTTAMESLKSKKEVSVKPKLKTTIADGIAVGSVGNLTLKYMTPYIEKIHSVTDDAIVRAVLALCEREHIIAEGAGAAAIAHVLQNLDYFYGKNTIICISGGNIDPQLLTRVIARGLTLTDRVLRVTASVSDKPGGLKKLLETVAELGGNVLDLIHDRTYSEVRIGDVDVELSLETRHEEHQRILIHKLEEAGFKPRQERRSQ